MSEPQIIRFPRSPLAAKDHDPEAADQARERIAGLPNAYAGRSMPHKEALIGAVKPVSPAAEAKPKVGGAPFRLGGAARTGAASTAAAAPAIEPPALKTHHHETASLPPVAASATTHAAHTPHKPTHPHKMPANPLASSTTAEVAPAKEIPGSKRAKPTDTPRSLPSRAKPIIVGVVSFILLFLVFKSPIFLTQMQYLITGQDTPAADTPKNDGTAMVAPDPVVSIPKINVNAPVVYATNNAEEAIQKDLESGVVHYANTALPGTNGNSVIFGHSSNDWWEPGNYKFVFVLLDKLVVGDTFTVNYNSHQYIYQVYETKVVEPTDMSVVAQTTDPQMTLITCTPPGTSWKRLVVRAKQISPAPQAAAETAPNAPKLEELPGSSGGVGSTLGGWWDNLTAVFH